MAGRKQKRSVEYFPHYVGSGKTMFTLEKMFGNDGYSTPFKILELLASTDEHCYDFSQIEDWFYICAKLNLEEERALKILEMLAKLDFIDNELFENKILWCSNLVENLRPVYEKRKSELPLRPITAPEIPIAAPEMQQSKVNKSKENEIRKEKESAFVSFWEKYPKKVGRKEAEKSWMKIDSSVYGVIMPALDKISPIWEKSEKRFIPHPATWLNKERWNDEIDNIAANDSDPHGLNGAVI